MLNVENVSKIYKVDKQDFCALSNISFEVKQGEIFGIIGKSGAGKTTLLRILSQLEVPTSGKIILNNEVISEPNGTHSSREQKRKTGVVFQGYPLLMQKTVFDNVAFPLIISGKPRQEIEKEVLYMLDLVELKDKANSYPSSLSGGQKQRVAIARALVSKPEIILLDEPTSALDVMTTSSIVALIKKINTEQKVTVIVITHEISIVPGFCDRVAVLDSSRIVDYGTVDEVFNNPTSEVTKQLIGWREKDE